MVFQNSKNFPTHPKYGHLSPERIARLEAKDHTISEEELANIVKRLKQEGLYETADEVVAEYQDVFLKKTGCIGSSFSVGIPCDLTKHDVTNTYVTGIHIDGLTVSQFRAVHDKKYRQRIDSISKIITNLKAEGREAEALDLYERFKPDYQAAIARNLSKQGIISPDLISKIDEVIQSQNCMYINGMPPQEWRLFNDPDYTPQLSHLKSWLRKYEENGEDAKVIFLLNKYDKLLNKGKPEPDVSIEEAEAMFRYIMSDAYRSDILIFDDNE